MFYCLLFLKSAFLKKQIKTDKKGTALLLNYHDNSLFISNTSTS